MTREEQKNRGARRGAGKNPPAALRFTRVNAALGAVGLLTLGVGYWLLAQGSITAAPLLLVLAYVVLLPLAIIR
jgi:hypothetical protein